MMKILHLTKKYPPIIGGDAFVVYNLRKQQIKSGHKVYVVTSNIYGIENKDVLKFSLKEYPFNLDRITPKRVISLFLLTFWGLINLKKLRPDIVHSHSADLGFFISIAARIYRIPVINTCHGISFNDKQYSSVKRFAEKFFLKYSGFRTVIAVDVIGLKYLKSGKIRNEAYIHNGIDLTRFQDQVRKTNQKTWFLFVGRLEKQKGLIYLIKAADILKNKKDFEIIIIGDGSEIKYLKNKTKDLNLEGFVKFKGKVDDKMLDEYYLKCDVFVLPSIWEGMPLTLLEAAAAGVPVITTNVGGILSVFTHEKDALIVQSKNPEALAIEMLRLMDDHELIKKLSENGKKLAEKFSWENSARKLDKIYKQVSK